MASILHLSNSHLPSTSANAVQTASMASAFAAIGHETHLICHAGPGSDEDVRRGFGIRDGVDLHRIRARGPRGTHTVLYLRDVREVATRIGPVDLLFSRDLHAIATIPRGDAPIVFEAHREVAGRTERVLFRRLLRSSRFVRLVVVSEGMRRAFLASFPTLDPAKVTVEPGAASVPRSSGEPLELRKRPAAFQVGYVGGLYQGRGIPLLREVAQSLPEIDFHLVGGSAEAVERWSAQAPENMHFYGHVDPTRLGFAYEQFDAVLAPYERQVFTAGRAETSAVMSPLKIFEYMAAGLPIVASDLPTIREVLDDDGSALLAPPDDANLWIQALARLESSPYLRSALGQRARTTHHGRHRWEERAKRVLGSFV